MAVVTFSQVNSDLATQGLVSFALPTTREESVGVNKQNVEDACAELRTKATNMQTFIGELEGAKAALLDRTWTGQAANDFATLFPGMIDAFEEIVPAIKSMADWAESTMYGYETVDTQTASALSSILNGFGRC